MKQVLLGYLFSYGYVFAVLGFSQLCKKLLRITQEDARKIIHVGLVFTWLIIIRFLKGTVHSVIIPGSFVVLNYLAYLAATRPGRLKIPLLSAMERDGGAETPGTVYYALSIAVMALITCLVPPMLTPCGIGLFCMAFGDGMAGAVGKRLRGIWKKPLAGDKTLGGSLACVIFAAVGSMILLLATGQPIHLGKLALLGIICGVLELPGKGLDNLTVPFGCMLAAYLLL